MVLAAAANTVAYALTSYMPTYLTSNKGYSEVDGTLLTIPVLVAMALCIPFTGRLSDRIGRLPVAFSVPNLASALSALFPTEHRYSAMGIAYNVAVANQDNDPLLDLDSLPFEESFAAARASHNRPGKPTVM